MRKIYASMSSVKMDARSRSGLVLAQFMKILLLSCAVLVIFGPHSTRGDSTGTSFVFSKSIQNISDELIDCQGSASLTTSSPVENDKPGAMCLVPPNVTTTSVAGRCIRREQVVFSNNSLSFSTMFSFNTINYLSYVAGEGFTFFFGTDPNITLNSTGGYLGWLNSTYEGDPTGHNFAVEFDIYMEHAFGDLDNNHVGINVNNINSSLNSSLTTRQMYLTEQNIFLTTTDTQKLLYVWIDYDDESKHIDVWLNDDARKPCSSVLSTFLDLENILVDNMYVGFTSSTGSSLTDGFTTSAQTTVYDWSFSTTGEAENIYGSHEKCHNKKMLSWLWIVVIVVAAVASVLALFLCLVCLLLLRRTKKVVNLETDLERVKSTLSFLEGPKNYDHEELSSATNGFSKKQIIGRGGFGTVYKGMVSSRSDRKVIAAIKKINKMSPNAIKEFVAEVSVIGQLRHVNMVPLLGWCAEKNELLLVYEFMPNKNLQELLFATADTKESFRPLTWDERLRILRGVAAALVFLHHDCERKVVHRDVKSSNVMLDQNNNARLGDFGLARMYDCSEQHYQTNAAGTIGYMAPEIYTTGNATTKSDVYSFGAMVLEVLTGRRPSDTSIPGGRGLMNWVWELKDADMVLEAVDPSLHGIYDEEHMKKCLKMGLFCQMYDEESRPTMLDVQTVLLSESKFMLADLPSLKSFHDPSRHLRLYSETDLTMTSFEVSDTDWGSGSYKRVQNLSRSVSSSLSTKIGGDTFNMAYERMLTR